MQHCIRIIAIICLVVPAFASRNYDSIEIPNAYCGDGSPYKVFVEARSSSRLGLKIQGGGACWSHFTCFTLGTARGSIPRQPKDSQGFSSDSSFQSPIADFSYIYFPYCTGDVHLGTHIASYDDKSYRHSGKDNIYKAVRYLMENQIVNPQYIDELVLYGDSAGALGALYHINHIAPYFEQTNRKTLLLDSPGLHFGDSFWYTFTDELFSDYQLAMNEIGYEINKDSGLIADVIPRVCSMHSDWQVGVIQTTRDRTMSIFFGGISAGDHERRVLGEGGIFRLTANPNDNCSAFVPDSNKHVLMNKRNKLDVVAGGKNVVQYTYEMVQEGAGANYSN